MRRFTVPLAVVLVLLAANVPLMAEGWPGLIPPTLASLKAQGAELVHLSGVLSSPRADRLQVWILGGVLNAFDEQGTLREVCYFPGASATQFQHPANGEDRTAAAKAGTLPALPGFVTALNLSWSSSIRDWLRAFRALSGYTFFSTGPPTPTVVELEESPSGEVVRHHEPTEVFFAIATDDPQTIIQVNLRIRDGEGPDAPFALDSLSLQRRSDGPQGDADGLSFASREPVVLDQEHRSALALSALLFEQNQQHQESLSAEDGTEDAIADEKRLLAQDWGLHSREELLDMIASLGRGLHSRIFRELSAVLDAHPGQEAWQVADSLRMSSSRASRLLFVAALRSSLGPQGIEAWDEGRRVALARWGFDAGYLSEAETWDLLLAVWKKLRGHYRSWNDYFYHYIAGRAFWALSFENDLSKTNEALEAWASLDANQTGVWHSPWPDASMAPGPDHTPWSYLYNPSPEAQALYDVLEQEAISPQTDNARPRAWERLDRARKRAPAFEVIGHAVVSFHLRFGEVDQALAEAQAGVQAHPTLARPWADLGDAEAAAQHGSDADKAYSRALDLDPAFLDALDGLSRVALAANDLGRASTLLQRALSEATPAPTVEDNPMVYLNWVAVLTRTQRAPEARPWVEQLLAVYPKAPSVQFEAGLCYYYLGHSTWPQARDAFRAAADGGLTLPPGVVHWLQQSEPAASAP